MMKQNRRILRLFLLLLCSALLLAGCKKGPAPSYDTPVKTWQQQYDLGVRYLSDGNYEKAILAFTEAITIDPKRPEAYAGRAEAYRSTGNQEAAREDIQAVIELAPDFDFTPYRELEPIVEEVIIENTGPVANTRLLTSACIYDYYGTLSSSTALSYDAAGRMTEFFREEWVSFDGAQEYMTNRTVCAYDGQGNLLSVSNYRSHGGTDSQFHSYDGAGQRISTETYGNEELQERTSYEYSPEGLLTATYQTSEYDNELFVCQFSYNDASLLVQETRSLDGLTETITYEYDSQNRLIREAHTDFSVSYDYSLKPFVIKTSVYSSGDIYNEWQYLGQYLFDFYPNAVACDFDPDGYVTRIYPNDPADTSFYVELYYDEAGNLTGGAPTVEEMAETLKAIYNAGADPSLGTYEVYPDEVMETEAGWYFTVRFASTAENAQANVLVDTVFVDRMYQATDSAGNFLINLQDHFM